ncbi:Zn-ribbon domain-containing OB-fold protein [Mycobacterium sp. AZCC_0083]|uniref:Zn-ribbon domain-containing OB-fold protein n=1 Tax=Mycobacterium sp. AZCC_0083 TaxID=2735882 RepID=UPI00160FD4CC|nr:OB-fold domain-containing protein [Mycobacterium sp. AZCC_0083]MBB5167841.1 putative OB-fold protein [Mycobacterium sp. AZCC_0083]
MPELGELSLGYSLLDGSGAAYRLRASRCPRCADVRVPPRELCPNDATPCTPTSLTGAGTIYEAVRIAIPPQGFDVPFWAGYIDLDEGVRFFAQITCADGEPPPVHGQRVAMNVEWIGTGDRRVLAPMFSRVET